MAFGPTERSNYGGAAVFLYEFQIGDNVWRYTSADSDIAAGGQAWESQPIEHDRVSQTGDAEQDSVTLTVPSRIVPATLYVGSSPSRQMMVRFRKVHDGDNDAPIFYVGIVSSVDWPAPGRVQFVLTTLSATLSREGLTLTYQRGCRNVLYGQGRGACNVRKEQYRVAATVRSTASGIVTLAGIEGYPDGWFDGGFIHWLSATRSDESRTIERYTGGHEVRLFGLSDGLVEGMQVSVYPGCPRTAKACDEKFNNMDNYGGQPHLPGDSPFDGNPI